MTQLLVHRGPAGDPRDYLEGEKLTRFLPIEKYLHVSSNVETVQPSSIDEETYPPGLLSLRCDGAKPPASLGPAATNGG